MSTLQRGLHKILKKTAYGRNIETQFKTMYGGLGGGPKGGIRNPKEIYGAFKHKNKDSPR